MRATRASRSTGRRNSRPLKRASRPKAKKRAVTKAVKPAPKPVRAAVVKAVKVVKKVAPPPEPVLYKLCKPGWSVIVEQIANAQGTRFVCPFCPKSHRVPGPVRGFKKMRRAQWGRLRRVEE